MLVSMPTRGCKRENIMLHNCFAGLSKACLVRSRVAAKKAVLHLVLMVLHCMTVTSLDHADSKRTAEEARLALDIPSLS